MDGAPTSSFENETNRCLEDFNDDVICGNSTLAEEEADPTIRTIYSVIIWSILIITCVLWYLCVRKERPELTTRGPFIKYFTQSGCQMEVRKEDFQNSDITPYEEGGTSTQPGDNDGEAAASFLVLSGKPSSDGPNSRVPNRCTVCTESYKTGETVVWSHDAECRHVFHRNCLIDYLLNVNGEDTPCPVCRRNFCSTNCAMLGRNSIPT